MSILRILITLLTNLAKLPQTWLSEKEDGLAVIPTLAKKITSELAEVNHAEALAFLNKHPPNFNNKLLINLALFSPAISSHIKEYFALS